MMKHTVSIEQCTEQDILRILGRATLSEANSNRHLMDGTAGITLFLEPPTRTRLSFETTVNGLGGRTISFSDPKFSSSTKGKPLRDTPLIVSNYADVVIIRHYLKSVVLYATEVPSVPIANAGDGANQHLPQTLLDLYTIRSTQGILKDLHIAMIGDLCSGRTIHSFIEGMCFFSPRFTFVAPSELGLPEEHRQYYDEHHLHYEETSLFTPEAIADTDTFYVTRVQRECFTDMEEYERVKDVYIFNKEMLQRTKDNLRTLYPLPRVNEIDIDVDSSPKAEYFRQAQNRPYIRQLILCEVLGIEVDK